MTVPARVLGKHLTCSSEVLGAGVHQGAQPSCSIDDHVHIAFIVDARGASIELQKNDGMDKGSSAGDQLVDHPGMLSLAQIWDPHAAVEQCGQVFKFFPKDPRR